jgi:hypothetical protein
MLVITGDGTPSCLPLSRTGIIDGRDRGAATVAVKQPWDGLDGDVGGGFSSSCWLVDHEDMRASTSDGSVKRRPEGGPDILQGNNNTVGMAKHEERKTLFYQNSTFTST